jgi:hypothetical protein
MPSRKDRLRAWPMITSFEQSGTHLRLFLPYQPLRDNLLLEQVCDGADPAADGVACLRLLWSLRLDSLPLPLAEFIAAERMDINMRGLVGVVPLLQLSPGMHTLEVTWNPIGFDESLPLDDRYLEPSNVFRIPFLYQPGVEVALPERRTPGSARRP